MQGDQLAVIKRIDRHFSLKILWLYKVHSNYDWNFIPIPLKSPRQWNKISYKLHQHQNIAYCYHRLIDNLATIRQGRHLAAKSFTCTVLVTFNRGLLHVLSVAMSGVIVATLTRANTGNTQHWRGLRPPAPGHNCRVSSVASPSPCQHCSSRGASRC